MDTILTDGHDGKLVDAAAIADLLGVKPSWVRRKSREGDLPVLALGKYRRYSVPQVLAWAEKQRRA